VYLNNAPYGAPTPWFHGQVIDFIFFDLWEGILPRWLPIWGGQYFSMPIFNFADACIFVGVCLILFFQRRFYQQQAEEQQHVPVTANAVALPTADATPEPHDVPATNDTNVPDSQHNGETDKPASVVTEQPEERKEVL
jgi:signal peptidase II